MRELNVSELNEVSGAGVIANVDPAFSKGIGKGIAPIVEMGIGILSFIVDKLKGWRVNPLK